MNNKGRHFQYGDSMKPTLAIILTFALPLTTSFAMAQEGATYDRYEVKKNLSDGQHGNWREWRAHVQERAVKTVTASLQLQSGTEETYVSLGFEGERWFEPVKMSVGDESLRDVSWDAGGVLPNGRQLLMKGYNGAVKVHEIIVRYADGGEAKVASSAVTDTKPAISHVIPPPREVPPQEPISIRTTLLDLKEASEILYRRVTDDTVLGKDDMIVDTAQDVSRTSRHILSRVLSGGESKRKNVDQILEQMKFLRKQIERTGVQEEGLQRKFERVEFLALQLKERSTE